MAMDDLFAAMKMFKEGVQEYQLGSAIANANDRVHQMKAQLTNEAEQRAALQGIANDLTTQMSTLGAPVSQIQTVTGALGPKKFANAAEMYREGVLSANPGLQTQAEDVQEFENNPKYLLAQMRAARAMDTLAQARFEEAKDMATAKWFERFSKTIDETEAVRNAFGKTGQGIQRANQVMALIGKAETDIKAGNAIPPQMVYEMAASVASLVKGGQQPTIDDIKHFMVNNIGLKKAEAEQFLTNGVHGANAGKFVQLYAKTAQRERAELATQSDDTVLERAQGNLLGYKRDPQLFVKTVADRLNVKPEDVIVDMEKRTITTKQKQAQNADIDLALSSLKNAYKATKGDNPAERAKAAQVFRALGVDPNVPIGQATQDVRYRISRGLL